MTVFISEAVGAERLVFGASQPPGSARLRRWKHLAALYRESLAACGYPTRPILRPEIYQAEIAREVCGAMPGDWHLAVKPLEHLRPFHGVPNVFVCDWAYTSLSASSGPGAPFLNHVRLLGRAAVVACCTEAALRAVRRAGLTHAVHLPPAIAPSAATGPRVSRTGSDAALTFLAAMDADDPPEAWASLLRGFAAARRGGDGRLKLLIAVDGAVAADVPPAALLSRLGIDGSDAVSFVAASPKDAICRYVGEADYFLDVAPVGGLPIASVEAVLAGLPLVAVRGDWVELPGDLQVPVGTVTGDVEPAEEPAAGIMPLQRERPTSDTICDAVLTAAALSPVMRRAMAENGQSFAMRQFGSATFGAALRQALEFDPGAFA